MNGESEKLYFKTAPPTGRRPKEIARQVKDMTLLVEFTHPELCAQTRPVNCLINGRAVIPDKQNWSGLLTAITERFIQDNNPNLGVLDRKPIYGSKAFFMPQKMDFGTSSKLSNGKWIYTNYNSQIIVTIIGNLCRHCGVSLNNILITYAPKDSYVLRRKTSHAIMTKPKIVVGNKIKDVVLAILEQHFQNGIRPSSIIDINKLKNYYRVASSEELPSEIEISSLLYEIGTHHGKKVFVIPSDGKKGLSALIEDLISEGNELFYYNEFYKIHAKYLQQIHIFSAELLKTVLPSLLPSLYYTKKYFSVTRKESAESAVLSCFYSAESLSYQLLKEKLPYVPLAKIKQVLAQSKDFIWVNEGVYTHASKIKVDEAERLTIERKIKAEITTYGYASLAAFDISASLEINPTLSETAVKRGLFQVCFADRYEKRGIIITSKGAVLNTVDVFKDYCLSREFLTLEELLDLQKAIIGRNNSQSLFAAYDSMIRVDKHTFVADNKIRFDIEAVDNALGLFVHTDVIPLQAVTSFNSFPYINGYSWNLYLVESYCRRFSKRFMYQCLSVNSRNIGAVYRKSAGFEDYIDVLAAAVVTADIELNEKEIGDFLFERRYVAMRTGAVSKVVAKTRALRDRGI